MSITPAPGPPDDLAQAPPAVRVAWEDKGAVPPFIWAAALQVYWLVRGLWGTLSGGFLFGLGLIGASAAMRPGFPATSEGERMLFSIALALLAGAVDVAASTVLTYGMLTLKRWVYRVFMAWLPVKLILWIAGLVMPLSLGTAGNVWQSQSSVVVFINISGMVLQAGMLIAGFLLVRRGNEDLVR